MIGSKRLLLVLCPSLAAAGLGQLLHREQQPGSTLLGQFEKKSAVSTLRLPITVLQTSERRRLKTSVCLREAL